SDYRNWNTLAFRGWLMSLLELRSAGSHRGLWDCDYSPHRKHFLPLESRVFQLLDWDSFSTSCFTIPIHPIIIYMILSFVNSKRYLVNWNARRRLLGLGLRTARPIENHCDYSTHRKHLREKQQLKIPQEAVFASEEAEALPAESDCPEWKLTCSYVTVYSC